ncbi:zinc ribbon domain-containing protein [Spirulina major]|uniref:zinc ribbon domain-containing protein n=1 Tax=Spirulina major TaxID=270636 RepID=UPI000933C941|nr:zinc ribbon domain-containing protein [Spirulina major]
MAYFARLTPHQEIELINRDRQTVITLTNSHSSQQQAQSASYTTGPWLTPPTLWRDGDRVILRIESDTPLILHLQGQAIAPLDRLPPLPNADVIPLQRRADPAPMPPMEPMQPMEPMTMGNMTMNPMQMKMGNMELRMDNATPSPGSPASQAAQFCPQCGHKSQGGDRFCRACGQSLTT